MSVKHIERIMTVVSSVIESGIKSLLDSNPEDTITSAREIAAAYHDYASAASFGSSAPTLTPAQKTALEKTILSGINAQNIDAFCNSIQNGIVTYWTAVPVAGTSGAGVTTPPTGNIVSALKLALTQPYPDSINSTSKIIATQMDLLTKTTAASLTIPSTPPVTAIFPLL